MATDVLKSKTEFLKRYMEKDSKSKRKKKPKPSSSHLPRLKILDGNVDLKSMKFGDEVEVEEDEAPVVAEIIDDRPQEVKVKELYQASRWKKIDSSEAERGSVENRNQAGIGDSQLHHQQSSHRNDSDSDCSLPRRQSQNNISHEKHKNTSRSRHDSDSDCSPPRHHSSSKRTHNSDSDVSPPRERNLQSHEKQNSPISKRLRNDSDSDLSPARNRRTLMSQKGRSRRNSDSDLSPPRQEDSSRKDDKKRSTKTLSGLKAGLQNATSLREETKELREKERRHMEKLDADLSGRHAGTIVRDRKTGKKRDMDAENREKEEKQKKVNEQQQKYSEWGKGIEQTAIKKSKFETDMYETSKPLARYQDDEDLDAQLRAVIHADDPMADYMKKKQKDSVSVMPEYKGPAPPPNRFGIRPGYRWDGVDRSNGFEKKYFEKQSSSKAREEEAYLWSVQDM